MLKNVLLGILGVLVLDAAILWSTIGRSIYQTNQAIGLIPRCGA